jgi:3-methyladenine DNA glycosylase AlkD
MLEEFKKEYKGLADKNQARILSGFFKTGPGQYGEGDVFLGIKVPIQRAAIKKYFPMSLVEVEKLLSSSFHEHRLSALFILIRQFEKGDDEAKEKIYKLYLKALAGGQINNWDLVDMSAPNIVGKYLEENNRSILYALVSSKNLWERRVAVLATFTFIRNKDFKDILVLAKKLLSDKEDLMHKAVGWMLREAGKRDEAVLRDFLNENVVKMPRTMLRYAIEKFDERERKKYLSAR